MENETIEFATYKIEKKCSAIYIIYNFIHSIINSFLFHYSIIFYDGGICTYYKCVSPLIWLFNFSILSHALINFYIIMKCAYE